MATGAWATKHLIYPSLFTLTGTLLMVFWLLAHICLQEMHVPSCWGKLRGTLNTHTLAFWFIYPSLSSINEFCTLELDSLLSDLRNQGLSLQTCLEVWGALWVKNAPWEVCWRKWDQHLGGTFPLGWGDLGLPVCHTGMKHFSLRPRSGLL